LFKLCALKQGLTTETSIKYQVVCDTTALIGVIKQKDRNSGLLKNYDTVQFGKQKYKQGEMPQVKYEGEQGGYEEVEVFEWEEDDYGGDVDMGGLFGDDDGCDMGGTFGGGGGGGHYVKKIKQIKKKTPMTPAQIDPYLKDALKTASVILRCQRQRKNIEAMKLVIQE